MANHKRSKHGDGSARKDPFLTGLKGLQFEGINEEEISELTDEQKATAFLSRYQEKYDPFIAFKNYFEASVKGEAWDMRELKNYYLKLVIRGNWSEEKLITVVNSIYRENQSMSPTVVDARGRKYDNGALRVPAEPGKNSRRRGRI